MQQNRCPPVAVAAAAAAVVVVLVFFSFIDMLTPISVVLRLCQAHARPSEINRLFFRGVWKMQVNVYDTKYVTACRTSCWWLTSCPVPAASCAPVLLFFFFFFFCCESSCVGAEALGVVRRVALPRRSQSFWRRRRLCRSRKLAKKATVLCSFGVRSLHVLLLLGLACWLADAILLLLVMLHISLKRLQSYRRVRGQRLHKKSPSAPAQLASLSFPRGVKELGASSLDSAPLCPFFSG